MVWGAACVKVQEIQANLILIHPPSAHPQSLFAHFFTHTTFSSTFPPFNQWKSHFICFFSGSCVLLCEDFFHAAASFHPLHRSSHAVALVLAMKRENSMCHTTQWRSQRQQQKKSQKFIDFPPLSLVVVKLYFEFPPYFVCRCRFFFCGIIELKCHTPHQTVRSVHYDDFLHR